MYNLPPPLCPPSTTFHQDTWRWKRRWKYSTHMHLFTTDMIWNKFRGRPAAAGGNCCPWQGFKINICQCQLNTFSAASKLAIKSKNCWVVFCYFFGNCWLFLLLQHIMWNYSENDSKLTLDKKKSATSLVLRAALPAKLAKFCFSSFL